MSEQRIRDAAKRIRDASAAARKSSRGFLTLHNAPGAVAVHVGIWQPKVADAVADLLEVVADEYDLFAYPDCTECLAAIAVADAILDQRGGAS